MTASNSTDIGELSADELRQVVALRAFFESLQSIMNAGRRVDVTAGGVVLNSASGGRDRLGSIARDRAELEIFPERQGLSS